MQPRFYQHARGLLLVGRRRLPVPVTQQQQQLVMHLAILGAEKFEEDANRGLVEQSPVPEADNNNKTKTRKHGQRSDMTQILMRVGRQASSCFFARRPVTCRDRLTMDFHRDFQV